MTEPDAPEPDVSEKRESRLWTEHDVSAATGIPLGTLRYWRAQKKVFPFTKLGQLVRYEPSDIDEVLRASKVQVTTGQDE